MSELLLDAAGRRRSPATLPQFHAGRPPRNKGMRYPADPPTIEEIVAVMRSAGDSVHGRRLRGLIVVLWRAGLRIHEALALAEADLDPRRGSLLVRRGKGGRRREVGMDDWAWEQLAPWLQARVELPVGPLFCVVNGATRGRPGAAAAARSELRRVAREAGVRRRFAPHQLRHAHAVEMAREGVPLIVIQRQLGHTNLGITSIYLQGIDNTEIIDTVHARRAPIILVHSSLRLRTANRWPRSPTLLGCRSSSNPAARRPSATVPADCSIRRGAEVSTCAPAPRPLRELGVCRRARLQRPRRQQRGTCGGMRRVGQRRPLTTPSVQRLTCASRSAGCAHTCAPGEAPASNSGTAAARPRWLSGRPRGGSGRLPRSSFAARRGSRPPGVRPWLGAAMCPVRPRARGWGR
jgi:hypothetical protein